MSSKIIELARRLIDEEPPDEAFYDLFGHFARPLDYFFQKRGFSNEDSQDLVQDTFLGIYLSRGDLRDPARFVPWMYRIATNAWYNRVRRAKADKRLASEVSLASADHDEDLPVPADGPDPAVLLIYKEQKASLDEAIKGLPPQMQACLRLWLQGFKYREIGELLKLSPNTVKSQVHQAKERLLGLLVNFEVGEER